MSARVVDGIDLDTIEGAAKFIEITKENPDWWIENILGCSMWDIPKRIARSTFLNPRTAVRSCTSSSKSHTAARVAVCFLYTFDPSTVITTAPTYRQVESILWREIRSAWTGARATLAGDLKQTEIHLRDDWFAIGLSTDEPERFQGLHNLNVLVIGDEASGLTPNVYAAIENPLAAGNTHELLIGNPTQPIGEFKDCFTDPNKANLYTHFHISCFDTPNFKQFDITMDDIRNGDWEVKVGDSEMPRPYLISPQWVAERYQEWGETSPLFQCYCLGNFPESGINTLIPLYLIEDAMNVIKQEAKGAKVAALDVSRYGDSETVFMVMQGSRVFSMHTWQHQDSVYSAGRVARLIREYEPIVTRIDTVGVGAGVFDQLKNHGFNVEEFNAALPALDREYYANIRAEMFFEILHKLQDGKLQLPNDNKLKNQLADIRHRYNVKNQLIIESKEEARSRGVKSPDRADALMMLMKPVDMLAKSKPKVKYYL